MSSSSRRPYHTEIDARTNHQSPVQELEAFRNSRLSIRLHPPSVPTPEGRHPTPDTRAPATSAPASERSAPDRDDGSLVHSDRSTTRRTRPLVVLWTLSEPGYSTSTSHGPRRTAETRIEEEDLSELRTILTQTSTHGRANSTRCTVSGHPPRPSQAIGTTSNQ